MLSEVVGFVPSQLEPLEKLGLELINLPERGQPLDESQIIAALKGAWGVIAGGETYSRQVLESVRTLRVIARTGVGYDAIDVDAATELGVAVVTTPGANAEAVADFTLALILACLRRTIEADADVRSGPKGPLVICSRPRWESSASERSEGRWRDACAGSTAGSWWSNHFPTTTRASCLASS